jgi:diaminohydroxyphosphoribosylaminopyrimidine deaminase/5-amino-6-(5-phosphoribosylamino)uracil reductase
MVGAVLVKSGKIIGRGWHHRAGQLHAEVEAIRDATRRGHRTKGATLYVTLEPCSTQGRTPPCTEAISAAGIRRVVVGATDPNPRHRGKAFAILKQAGIKVTSGVLAEECANLNEAFNHWIVRRTPFVIVKTAMTVDGRIATKSGDSKWITGEKARAYGMRLRQGADAILVGINTVLADDPRLTYRGQRSEVRGQKANSRRANDRRSEVRGQRTHCWRSEGRSQRSRGRARTNVEIGNLESRNRSGGNDQRSEVRGQKSGGRG